MPGPFIISIFFCYGLHNNNTNISFLIIFSYSQKCQSCRYWTIFYFDFFSFHFYFIFQFYFYSGLEVTMMSHVI